MPIIRRKLLLGSLALAAPSLTTAAGAGTWPERLVRIVIAFSPGGTTDIVTRPIGAYLSERWGRPVVIENRSGASGIVGTEYVIRSAPDGYTLLATSNGPLVVNQSLFRNLSYDARRDFSPITLVVDVPNALVVAPHSPIQSVDDLVARARRQPGALSYGSTGNGTASHLAGALLDQMAGIQTTHVPYRGALALNDLLSGRLDFMFATLPSILEHLRGGNLRAIAVSSVRRSRSLPDIPTVSEVGYADFNVSAWFGIVAPAATPEAIVDQIAADVRAALRQPAIEQQMIEQGADPVGNSPSEFKAYIEAEVPRWAELVHRAGATVD